MAADRTTDAIAHFIGMFGMAMEQNRLRDGYDGFTTFGRRMESGSVETHAARVIAELDARSYDPKPMAAQPVSAQQAFATDGPIGFDGSLADAPARPTPMRAGPDRTDDPVPSFDSRGAPSDDNGRELRAALTPHAPSSALIVTHQTALLADDDTLGTGPFRDGTAHADDLAKLAATAAALHAPAGPRPGDAPDLDDAETLADAMRGFASAPVPGFDSATLRGAEVPVALLDGRAAGDLPEWDDLLPAHHRPDNAPDAAADAEGRPAALPAWATPDLYQPNPEAPDGHSLVTGGNLLVNEAQVSTAWLDAPMIAVGGRWVDLTLVSQIAAVSNHDTGQAASDAGGTVVHQIVEIEATARMAPWFVEPDPGGGPPTRVAIDHIRGDLVLVNYLRQTIDVSDNDRFSTSIEAANTAYVLGDNTVFNAAGIVAFGFAYDLILVGEHFIRIDTVHQTLVLQDDDHIAMARGQAADDGYAGPAVKPGEGSGQDGVATMGNGVAGRDDIPTKQTAAEGAEASTREPAPDNLLMNRATLTALGVDTHAALSAQLAELLSDRTDDLDMLRERLMTDPVLAGMEQARVLKIDGSLTLSNTIEQRIHLSDRDDILIDGAVPPDLEIIAGSNALLNATAIVARGVDSRVMAAEDVYSDLLIHQARLVDEPAPGETPDGDAPGGALVNEALAFLMEETQATATRQFDANPAASPDQVAADAYDLLHGVLG